MTDPVCSWCWGMLPELLATRAALTGRLSFEIRCAGLQVGAREPLSEQHTRHLVALWQQVAATTGQRFAFALPEDTTFIYHSEMACRALQVCREHLGDEPWDTLHRLQEAFYVECRNICDPAVLFAVAEDTGISQTRFLERLGSDEIRDRTRAEFDWCGSRGITALPTVFLDQGDGPVLVCGGYATAAYLVPELKGRLSLH